MIVDAFYDRKSLFKQYNMLEEWNRLQLNFTYDKELHQMYVACSDNNSNDDNSSIIGFVDIDCRPSKTKMRLYDHVFNIWLCIKNIIGKELHLH